MSYTVVEMQNGVIGSNVYGPYSNYNEAESKYHYVLSVAAVSTVRKHGAAILNENCFCVKSECFEHEEAA